jgi:hypothetical protein
MMSKSLFLVGEIGGNDYNLPFLTKVPFKKIRTFTPSVVAKISSTIDVSYSPRCSCCHHCIYIL